MRRFVLRYRRVSLFRALKSPDPVFDIDGDEVVVSLTAGRI